MKKLTIDHGSFRDPDARVAYLNDSVYRIVYPNGFKKFDLIKKILENESKGEKVVKKKKDYITKEEPVNEENYGHIHEQLKIFFHQKDEKLNRRNTKGFLRLGVNQNKDKSSRDKDDKSTFRYIKEIMDEKSALLEFELEMEGVYINGVDLISWNEEGKIKEIKVIVRPLQAINMLHQKMQAMLESMK